MFFWIGIGSVVVALIAVIDIVLAAIREDEKGAAS